VCIVVAVLCVLFSCLVCFIVVVFLCTVVLVLCELL